MKYLGEHNRMRQLVGYGDVEARPQEQDEDETYSRPPRVAGSAIDKRVQFNAKGGTKQSASCVKYSTILLVLFILSA